MNNRNVLAGALAAAVLFAGLPAATGPAFAQSAQSLVRSLSVQKPKMRSFQAPGAKEQRVRGLVDTVRAGTRQITVEERKEVAEFVKENGLPSVDIEVFFEYDSAAITPVAMPKLQTLGLALSDAKLKGKTFMIAGHTDATGSAGYNQALSERRAQSVRKFLVDSFNLDPKTLVVIGFGEEQLKQPFDPASGENRRVQVVNLAAN
jgi:outer membrane protein OmpA-like peptidoglycan-associated protein